MAKAIGIDLGTTNSCAAIMEAGRPRMITYKGGEATIPSVFAIDDEGNRLVGREAKRQAQTNPTNTVMASKRLIGRNFHSKAIDKVRQVFTYEMLEGDNDEVLIKVKDQVFTLDQISAAILRRIKDVAEDALEDEIDQAVITVPAYFNDRQRQAVRNAGKMADLKVLRVLNEPTAAALAYGLGKNLSQRIAVYDLGGGTFDISVIDIKDRIFEVIATGGDTFLGGVDFDDRLMRFILEDFLDRHGVDLAWNRVAIQRIRDAAETAKIELSARTTTRVSIPYVTEDDDGEPLHIDMELSRRDLESLTSDLVDRTIATCQRIFTEAGTSASEVDEMLLVGGQSRMPLVREAVKAFMGKPASKGVHPDEAVGIGAAIMANSLAGPSGGEVTLLDVLPMPIGINKVDGSMHVLFKKNQPLPDYKTRTLTTSRENQSSIMLRIYQGESRLVKDNELLGTFVFKGIRAAPKGGVQIEVTFHIDSEGILNLTARDKETGQTVESTLKLGGNKKKPKKRKKKTAAAPATPAAAPAPAAAPPAPPPMPLTMPNSSLMQQLAAPLPEAASEPESDADAPTQVPYETVQPTAAPASPPPAPLAEAAPAGFFARIAAFFKGLFGG